MLKHERIIKRLSTAEKIGILTDITALGDDNIAKLGVPKLDVLYLKHVMQNKCPMPAALAHSWDRALIRDIAGYACNSVEEGASALMVTPGAKIKFSPYRNDLSEDPYLAVALSSEFSAGVKSTGLAGILSGYYMTDTDVELMDKNPSPRVLNEFLVKPYDSAVKGSSADAVMTDVRTLSGSYSAVNSGLRKILFESGATMAICDRVEADDTVSFIANGGICINGSAVALETALNRYQKLKQSLDSGNLTAGDLEAEIAAGRAISPEKINEATDRVIELAFVSCKSERYEIEDIDNELYYAPEEDTPEKRRERRRLEKEAKKEARKKAIAVWIRKLRTGEEPEPETEEEEEILEEIITPEEKLLQRAAAESVVLLRNVNGIAPIKKASSVAIIGGIADEYSDGSGTIAERCEMLLNEAGIEKIYKAQGYDLNSDRTDRERIITDALSAAARANVVLLFLGHGEGRGKDIPKTHKLSLPANQLLLAEKLAKYGARVIAVLESGYGMDIGFTDQFAAAVLAPFGCPYDAEAIVNVLLGRINPSGRLAYTLYSSFDTYAPKHAVYRENWNIKSGPFIGYRYYETAKLRVGYPFGHGLSYSTVDYSALTVNGDAVTFTLTNRSDMPVKEVAQVYIGAVSSNVIRPKKELCGFELVELGPKEERIVTVHTELPRVYDVAAGRFVAENCSYEITVGSSSHDERLKERRYGGSHSVASDKQQLVDYVQSKSNIIIDQYTLEANYRIMKRSAKNIVSGIVAMLMAISLGIYNSLEPSGAFIGILAGVLAIAGVFFFAAEVRERNAGYKQERVIIDKANSERFKDAEELPEFSAKRMFQDEFDVIENETLTKEAILRDDGSVDESLKYIDKDLDFARASKELRAFASDRGIELSDGESEKIFAAFAASRLVIFKDMKSDIFRSLVAVLSEYFETNPYIDTVDASYLNEESALFGASGDNNRTKKNLAYAIEAANNVKYNVHIAALDGVKCENMLNYFTPYAKYAKNPYGYTVVSAHNEWDKESTYYLPQNMWFCINLAAGESYADIPDYIAEIASVNVINPVKCKASNSHMVIGKFRYYQFDYLSERAGNTYGILEETWKKIDKLAAYVGSHSDFRIENKLCLALEKYAAALMASGIEIPDAQDASLAAKLLPPIVIAALDKIPEDERSLEESLDAIFSSDVLDECHRVIKDVAEEKTNKKAAELISDSVDADEDDEQTEYEEEPVEEETYEVEDDEDVEVDSDDVYEE